MAITTGALLVSAGVGASTAAFLAPILLNIAISAGLSLLASLIGGGPQHGPAQKQNIRQAVGPRWRYYGRVKSGGVFAFLNDRASFLYQCIMLSQGEIDAVEEHWLGSDLLTLGTDSVGQYASSPERYNGNEPHYVNLAVHTGSDSQAADTAMVANWSDVIDSNFRLLGIAYTRLRLLSPKPNIFSEIFPSGLPEYQAVYRAAKVWDPRDPAQDPDDPSTWTWTQNAALIIMDYLWHNDGMRLPRSLIEVAIETWKLQATACDTDRTLSDASVEPWYRLSGGYQLTDTPKQVLPRMLDAIDGRLGLRPDGGVIVDVGQWQPPDITMADRDIYSYSMVRGRPQADVRNEIRGSYIAPENDFIEQEAEPYRNETSITVDGLQTVTMDLTWCPSQAQARYRMKIEAGRNDATRWNGQIVTNAYGMKFMTLRGDGTRRRTISISIAELGISELSFEVQRFNFEVKTGRCTFAVTEMSHDDYDWDADTDQGTPSGLADSPAEQPVEDPSNLVVTVDDSTITGGIIAKHITATVDAPSQPSLTLALQYRTHDGGVTDDDAVWTDFIMDGDLSGHTGTLPDGGVYDVRATFTDPHGRSSNSVYERSVTIGYVSTLPTSPAGDILASQTLAAGDLVNLHTVTGAIRMRKADATDETKPAHGYVTSAVTSGNVGAMFGPGTINDAVTGLTPGATYFLSTTAGLTTATPPSTGGNIVQKIGEATSATTLLFEPEDTVQL
jgi:hypothetical protein